MADNNDTSQRYAIPTGTSPEGHPSFKWNLTDRSLTDPVIIEYKRVKVLPVIFVPGIMGTNLKDQDGRSIWNVNGLVSAAKTSAGQKPATRQTKMHPQKTSVFTEGDVPNQTYGSIVKPEEYHERGWGEISAMSYMDFLVYLEKTLNAPASSGMPSIFRRDGEGGFERRAAIPPKSHRQAVMEAIQRLYQHQNQERRQYGWKAQRDFKNVTAEEMASATDWFFPVYACGYNWLGDNKMAADRLYQRINKIITRHHNGKTSSCTQVIVITHSMGGLVARACVQQHPQIMAKIAGVIHGVMPTNGAAVAYRRCKVGMWDEDKGPALVIGTTGQHITPVFAQSPGALQLLPNQHYQKGWLEIKGPQGETIGHKLPLQNPYNEIYREKNKWWGLVKEEWLRPKGGQFPTRFGNFLDAIQLAESFHQDITPDTYHPNSYAFYGAGSSKDQKLIKGFERITWQVQKGTDQSAYKPQQIFDLTHQQVALTGDNPEQIGKKAHTSVVPSAMGGMPTSYTTCQYTLRTQGMDGLGDGTVPLSSGKAVCQSTKVKQAFELLGIEHEGAYVSLETASGLDNLFTRLKENLQMAELMRIDTLRKRELKVAGVLPARELLTRWNFTVPYHEFHVQTYTQTETTKDEPAIEVTMDAGMDNDSKHASYPSPLSDAQAIALWDKVVKSIHHRHRPQSSGAALVKPDPVNVGGLCPQSGWWLASKLGDDVHARIVNSRDDRRQHFQEGQIMKGFFNDENDRGIVWTWMHS